MGTCTLTVKMTGLGPGHCADSFRERHAQYTVLVESESQRITDGSTNFTIKACATKLLQTCEMFDTPRSRVTEKLIEG